MIEFDLTNDQSRTFEVSNFEGVLIVKRDGKVLALLDVADFRDYAEAIAATENLIADMNNALDALKREAEEARASDLAQRDRERLDAAAAENERRMAEAGSSGVECVVADSWGRSPVSPSSVSPPTQSSRDAHKEAGRGVADRDDGGKDGTRAHPRCHATLLHRLERHRRS
jgi:hypothetical protein